MHDTFTILETFVQRWIEFERREANVEDHEWVTTYLEYIYDIDQAMRQHFIELIQADALDAIADFSPEAIEIDRSNRMRLKTLIDQIGWPRISVYGVDTCTHAWMIAIHADLDVSYLQWAHAQMTTLVDEGEADVCHLAALYDRIALAEGRKQYWGMFYNIVDGEEVLCPTEDVENLDARRAQRGLGETRYRRG